MFRKNPHFEREVKRSPAYKRALANAAEPAAASARGIAHRIMPSGRGQGIHVDTSGDEPAIVNPDHGAHLDEWGSKNNPIFAPLRRGIRAAGLRFKALGR